MYEDILQQIKEVEQKIEGLTFEEARDVLCGFNYDGDIFDYDYKSFTGTIENNDGLPKMAGYYDIYNMECQIIASLSKEQIEQMQNKPSFTREEIVYKMQKYILSEFKTTNAFDFEVLGRAIKGCEQIAMSDDNLPINGYGYAKRKWCNADWQANRLIECALKNYARED